MEEEAPASPKREERLLIVANRLPVSGTKDDSGRWTLKTSSGGLVSAMMGVQHAYVTRWIGWPGMHLEPGPDRDELDQLLRQEGYVPVWFDEKTVDLYYNGYCNQVLWQLFHYVPLPLEARLSETRTMQAQWAAYQEANRRFAQAVVEEYDDGDLVWCHDYHVVLLPQMLKQLCPDMKLGFFIHTPFPSSEIYRTLPMREELLRGLLSADLIGFHTYDYARHFVSACTRILGLEGTPEGVEDSGQITRIAAFPIGIDPARFSQALDSEKVKFHITELRKRFAGRKVMLGVDRLDMIKGIPQKLLAYEKFLDENPSWKDKVLLVQIAVPTRMDVPEYQQLRSLVHEIVGRINGKFGTLTHVPIHHLDRSLEFHELVALYAVTDVCLVTSLRDGMNLVSYEYVACQKQNSGVLILSEFAGAAQSLGAGALLVNPHNVIDITANIEDALTMSGSERKDRQRQNYLHVTTHTAQVWADTFVSELNDTHVEAQLRNMHIPPQLPLGKLVRRYKRSKKKVLILGYNATLTTSAEAPGRQKRQNDQIRSLTRVHPTVKDSIRKVCTDPNTVVCIFSGSEKSKLASAFGELPVWLAAENGCFIRPPRQEGQSQKADEWIETIEASNMDWMESVQLVFDYFCERTPRSYVDRRETSMVWNYKYADPEFGRLQARDMLQHLWTGPISNAAVDIVQGGRSVEVRPVGISKGLAMERIFAYMAKDGGEADCVDFILCAGHFMGRDEDIFSYFERGGQLTEEDLLEMFEGDTHSMSSQALPHIESTASVNQMGSNTGLSALGSSAALSAHDWSPIPEEVPTPTAFLGPQDVKPPAGWKESHAKASMEGEGSKYIKLAQDGFWSCTVGRKRSKARYMLNNSTEVATMLHELATAAEQTSENAKRLEAGMENLRLENQALARVKPTVKGDV